MTYDLDPDQIQLANLMNDISERCYCAAWMTDLEYVLWDAVINGQRKYGHGFITPHEIDELKKLSKACNAWIYFDDEVEETAVTLDTWELMFDKAVVDNPDILHR
jgi:hypothetical protein